MAHFDIALHSFARGMNSNHRMCRGLSDPTFCGKGELIIPFVVSMKLSFVVEAIQIKIDFQLLSEFSYHTHSMP